MLLTLIAASFPLFIYADFRQKRTADNDPDIEFDYNARTTSFVMMFTPFAALFYAEQFWITLFYMAPLYVYFWILMYIANKKSWCPFSKADVFISSSGLTTTIIAYYIWFHEGILVTNSNQSASSSVASDIASNTGPAIWPYYAFAILLSTIFISTLYEKYSANKKPGLSSSLITPAAVVLPLLPLFIEYYWWGMLVSIASFIIILPTVSALRPISVRGGMSFIMMYIHMMAVTLSVILYAILF
ncbi:hypothetical protein MNBD_GAMMA12-1026 [hydrothermal vent metagenome]|uniref:Uncharacterized protein n=1 Tax=hydrothermal vent metagenome TaxID=652676 RepID=A0A3B0Z7F9_9ZZZZ